MFELDNRREDPVMWNITGIDTSCYIFTIDIINFGTVRIKLGLNSFIQNKPSIGILMHSP
jgi:hypothetical protein